MQLHVLLSETHTQILLHDLYYRFLSQAYIRNFADKDGKVWQGGGGRNPPPEAPHLVVTTPEIESLRPKSPPAKN